MPKRPITRLVHGLLTAKIVLASATGILAATVYDQDDRMPHAETSALNGVSASETEGDRVCPGRHGKLQRQRHRVYFLSA